MSDTDNEYPDVECPYCGHEWELEADGLGVGSIVECPECGHEAEITDVETVYKVRLTSRDGEN